MNDNKMNATVTMGEGVVLTLDTYNELITKARLLDGIVEQTMHTVDVKAKEPGDYNKLRVEVKGGIELPPVIVDKLTDAIGARLAVEEDYVRSLFEAGIHRFDLSDFTFAGYHSSHNMLEIDLMKSVDFRRRWKAEEINHAKNEEEQNDD